MNCKRCQGLLIPPSEPSARRAVIRRFRRNGSICDECREEGFQWYSGGVVYLCSGAALLMIGYMMESIGVISAGVLSVGTGFWRQKLA